MMPRRPNPGQTFGTPAIRHKDYLTNKHFLLSRAVGVRN